MNGHPPLASGRAWTRVVPQVPAEGINNGIWVQDVVDPSVRARFKWPSTHEFSSPYSLGIERVAYRLSRELDTPLPVPDTYLEEVEARHGVLSMRVPGRTWDAVEDDILESRATFVNREVWPLAAVFDIFLGNPDRHLGNVLVEWDPPMQRRPAHGEYCASWLIDYGFSGLWPPLKFGDQYRGAAVETIPPDADWTPFWLERMRSRLPPQFRTAWQTLGSTERDEVFENVQRITDDQVEAAVRDVPFEFFGNAASERTIEFLVRRRDRIATLADAVFPP